MRNQNKRSHPNFIKLEFIARKLGELKNEVVFLGGCATTLFVSDPVTPNVRTTLDVDCIVNVLSLGNYHHFEHRLTEQGFKKSMCDDVICRWHYENVILDVMPADERILGFGNCWYKAAIKHAVTHQLAEDLFIKLVTAPYFLGTKLEAFKTRGNKDYLGSHDLEDIITVIDGRDEILNEIASVDVTLKQYLGAAFAGLLKEEKFSSSLPGHLNYGPLTTERAKRVLNRIHQISQCDEKQ